jgi:hypothetical protein
MIREVFSEDVVSKVETEGYFSYPSKGKKGKGILMP